VLVRVDERSDEIPSVQRNGAVSGIHCYVMRFTEENNTFHGEHPEPGNGE
jgi:hypothetical protein